MRLRFEGVDGYRDLEVTGDLRTASVGDLATALSGTTQPLWTGESRLDADRPLRDVAILDGDVLTIRPRGPQGDPRSATGLALVTVAGLETARRHPLPVGVTVVGRDASADLRLASLTVSRRHLRLTVSRDGSVLVEDLGSANGVRVDGTRIQRPARLRTGALLEIGGIALRLETDASAPPLDLETTPGCTVAVVHRPPPVPLPPALPVECPPPAPPMSESPTTFSWGTVLAPLLMSLAMAVLFDPRLALLGLLTPVMAGATWLENRWRNRGARRGHRRDVAHRAEVVEHRIRVAVAAARTRIEQDDPDVATLVERCQRRDARLWDRQGRLRVPIGLGLRTVPLETTGEPTDEDRARVASARAVGRLPVCVELGAVGIVGPADAARAVMRAMVVATVTRYEPGDLRLEVKTDAPEEWRWTAWLPHLHGSGPRLLIVDGASRDADVRDHLETEGAALVRADSRAKLPAACRTVLAVDDHGAAHLSHADGSAQRVLAAGLQSAIADEAARRLAPLRVPDGGVADGLPRYLGLLDHLDLDAAADQIWRRWEDGADGIPLPLGVTAHGPIVLDLVSDGPHALIAGTTGAGKSELLRTLVVGAAASIPPDRLNFVLVDYKGGSAFDACAELPHVAGVVTDLDENLAARALTCLEAELRHRERRLREVGTDDLGTAGLPRLAVVVDEFAALAKDLPDFVPALVDIAQRGRSLGMHLVLATQRPGGAVTDDIRANTNLRICLRVQDRAESRDVVGCDDAADLERSAPGRAVVRCGGDDPGIVQTAWAAAPRRDGRLEVRPLGDGPSPADADLDGLSSLVAACREAGTGHEFVRRPWPAPLPERVTIDQLSGAIGLADEPEAQRQVPVTIDLDTGAAVFVGMRDAGTSQGLLTLATGLAGEASPDDVHLYVIDHGSGRLAVLEALPHCGGVIPTGDDDRARRLVRRLHHEVRRRLDGEASEPRTLLLLDGAPAFHQAFDDRDGWEVTAQLEQIARDGPPVGVHLAFTTDRPGAVPTSLLATAATRWCFALADPHDHAALGLMAPPPASPRGRCVEAPGGRAIQVAEPLEIEGLRDRWPEPACPPEPVRDLPGMVKLTEASAGTRAAAGILYVNAALDDDDLAPCGFELGPGDHALVAGAGRSGRSTALASLARVLTEELDIAVEAVAPRGGPLLDVAAVRMHATVGDLVAAAAPPGESRRVLMVDDVDVVPDAEVLGPLLAARRSDLHLVAAGRTDALRRLPAAWLAEVARTGQGLVLRPNTDVDGSLWSIVLPRPRRDTDWPPGRGFLLGPSGSRLVQVGVAP